MTSNLECHTFKWHKLAASIVENRRNRESRLAVVTGVFERTVTMVNKGLAEPERHAQRRSELDADEKVL